MKSFWYGGLAAVVGFGTGIILSFLLLMVFPVGACPGVIEGMSVVYDCSGWHPIKWSWLMPLAGWVAGPLLVNVIYRQRHKRNLYEMRKAVFLASVTGLGLALIIFLVLVRISAELMKII